MINKAIIVGNLGRDPEPFSAGCKLAVATSERFKKGDTWEERTEWHRVTVFGKSAEACQRFLAKGSRVYVEGRIQTSTYEKDGEKRYSTEIIANTVQFLDRKGDGPAPSQSQSSGGGFASGDKFEDDNIPF